jgi:peptide/nickel transport system substrate-binding protein
MFIFNKIEQLLYSLRDALWDYPENLLFKDDSLYAQIRRNYVATRPFSHFLLCSAVVAVIFLMVSRDVSAFLRINSTTLIEGVIIGVDENNQLQRPSRVNPLINTNIQLEKDLSELIYEGLITVDQRGEVHPVLADFLELREGRLYRFKLKDNLFWQDGVKVTTADVEATFNLIKSLEQDARTSTLFSRAATKMELSVLDEQSLEFRLNSALPTFFEAVSYKILPAHLLGDVNFTNISTSDPFINRNPVGTGRYKFAGSSQDAIELAFNPLFQGEKPSITRIKFKLYADEESALNALKSGQIHSLTGVSTDRLREVQTLQHTTVVGSNVIFNQYWGLYFNLGSAGPAVFKDKKVRQAISSGINRQFILDSLLGYAAEAFGPIPESSFAYVQNLKRYVFDHTAAEKLLDEAGWKLNEENGFREKNGERLKFNLLLVDNPDRHKIADLIQKDMQDLGIEVTVDAKNRDSVVNDHIIPRNFETLLYGVQTFIDPDRFELFDSSQIDHPGLNISSYKSEETVLTVVEGRTERVPVVDDALDDARKILDRAVRSRRYEILQNAVADEVPVVFLFHPEEAYAINRRLKNVRLDNINSIEQRFSSITEWEIGLD